MHHESKEGVEPDQTEEISQPLPSYMPGAARRRSLTVPLATHCPRCRQAHRGLRSGGEKHAYKFSARRPYVIDRLTVMR